MPTKASEQLGGHLRPCGLQVEFLRGVLPTQNSLCLWEGVSLGCLVNGPPCKIADFTRIMTRSVDIEPQFEKGLNDGISGGWQSKTTADVGPRGMSYKMPLKAGQCGYWSWVPIKKTVW